MTKRKSRRQRARERQKKTSPDVLRHRGAQAFRRGDYDMAIAAWRRIPRSRRDTDPNLVAAFAQACFRRGLRGHPDSLRQAVSLAGNEPRYIYHLALSHHRAGRMDEAEPLYRRVLDQVESGDEIGPRAAYALGLLLLETNRRPGRDPFWERLSKANSDSSLATVRQRLTWAEGLTSTSSTPSGPAPDPLWGALAARRVGREDPTPIDPEGMSDSAAAAHYHLGARAWEQDDAGRAFVHWRAAHDAGFDLPQLRDNLFAAARTVATERLEADNAEGALEAATAGLAIQPEDNGLKTIAGQAHFRLGHAAAIAGRWDGAYGHWQAVSTVSGKQSRRLIINLALVKEQQKNWREAAELWREALRRRPRKADHPDALDDTQVAHLWRHVAENYQRSGQIGEAVKTFRNALKWAPDDTNLRTAYVDLLLDDGRLVAADNQLDILLQARPDDVELLDRRAQVHSGQGYLRAAIRIWEQILKLQPDHAGAARQAARHYEKLGDNSYHWGWMQRAMDHYHEGLTYAPEDGMLLASLGMCHLDEREEKEARQFFDRACTAEPENQEIYLLIIKTWLDHNNWAAAEAVIRRAREALDLTAVFFIDIANFCYGRRRFDLAQDYLEQAQTLAAGDADLLLVIADTAGRNSDYELAQEIIEDVLQLDPNHAMACIIKGLALVSQGDLEAAHHSWNRAEKIARETNDERILIAVEEMRFLYDPGRGSPIGLLRRMLGPAMFDDEEWF